LHQRRFELWHDDMSKKHTHAVQRQFTRTLDAFTKYAIRDSDEITNENVDFAKPRRDDLMLDVACGPGTLALAFASQVRCARGIDVTGAMLLQARKFQAERGITNVAFDRGEAEQLPYPNASFDLVTCQCSLHHMVKPEVALAEIFRVVKTGGSVMIIDTLAPESETKFQSFNAIERLRDPSHAMSLRLTALDEMFDRIGFDVLRQAIKRRTRSFNNWMLRAGLEPKDQRYQEARRLIEESMDGDKAGFRAEHNGDDLTIVHNEGRFLLRKRSFD
jgi:ubiquinone/menaquinone biosynthesis C-methylase UbiE